MEMQTEKRKENDIIVNDKVFNMKEASSIVETATETAETILQTSINQLNAIVRPYQQEVRVLQQKADFIKKCVALVGKENFIELEKHLHDKMAVKIQEDERLQACKSPFAALGAYAFKEVEQYRLEFKDELERLAVQAELPLSVDLPRIFSLKGIEGTVDFEKRQTVINKKTLKSISPRRIVSFLVQLKRQLYGRPFDPKVFIEGIYQVYSRMVKSTGLSMGKPVPIQKFYLEHVISLQSKSFLQDMDQKKFRGYSLDQFVVDLWRYFEMHGGSLTGYMLSLHPGRSNAMMLIDSNGDRRNFTGLSFQSSRGS